METRKEKIKKIWEDHKKEIIIGSAAFVGGAVVVLVGKRFTSEELNFAKTLREFNTDKLTGNTMVRDMDLAMIGCNHADVFVNGDGVSITEAGERFINWYKDAGYNLDETKVTGLAAFIEK